MKSRIDKIRGTISGVSIITLGKVEGYGVEVDRGTLHQVVALASRNKSGIKVRYGHPGEGLGVLDTVGVLKNFRISGNRVLADMHLFKTDSRFNKVMEMAAVMPEHIGLSAVITSTTERRNGKALLRVGAVHACDLVDDPAANPDGLFGMRRTGFQRGSQQWAQFYAERRVKGIQQLSARFAKL